MGLLREREKEKRVGYWFGLAACVLFVVEVVVDGGSSNNFAIKLN